MKPITMRAVALALALLLWPGPARAQEHPATPAGEPAAPAHAADPHAAAAPGAAAHGEEKPALLQYDPGAAIWTIIIFVVLLIVLRAAAWKPMLRVLNEREQFIESSIAAAKAERAAAQQLLAEYQAQLDRARQEATALVEEGRRDGQEVRRRMHDEARKEADALVQRARREIRLATDAALKELYDRTAELSVQIAGRVLQRELSPADHRRLLEESLRAMQAAGASEGNGTHGVG